MADGRGGGKALPAGPVCANRLVCAIAAMHLDSDSPEAEQRQMTRIGSAFAASASLAVLVVAAPASAQTPSAGGPIRLTPHKAVYDLVLDTSKPSKSIEAARGRIAFDFTGDACEGYALSFRQVTQLTSESGPRVIDARTTSFEAGDGASYRFKTESSSGAGPAEIVDGTAEKGNGGYEVKLRAPKPETHREPADALFPNAQMKAVIAAARAGRTTLNVRLYDGANSGKEVYDTLSVIGKRIEAKPSETPLQRPEFESIARWPVTISYFKVGSGESTPAYTIAFELYENGVTGAVRLDYGAFALRGTLTRLDLLPAQDCAK